MDLVEDESLQNLENICLDLVAREGQKYFWTGGNVNHGRHPTIR